MPLMPLLWSAPYSSIKVAAVSILYWWLNSTSQAIALEKRERLLSRYSENAVLKRSYGVSDLTEVEKGSESIYSAWQKFLGQYQIKDFQVVRQQYRDRPVVALLQITANFHRGLIVVLSWFYEVQSRTIRQNHPGSMADTARIAGVSDLERALLYWRQKQCKNSNINQNRGLVIFLRTEKCTE